MATVRSLAKFGEAPRTVDAGSPLPGPTLPAMATSAHSYRGEAAVSGEKTVTTASLSYVFLTPTGPTWEIPPGGPVGRSVGDPEAEASFTPSDRPPPTWPRNASGRPKCGPARRVREFRSTGDPSYSPLVASYLCTTYTGRLTGESPPLRDTAFPHAGPHAP